VLSGSFLLYACAFLAVITVVVFVHELGHFLVGRWVGVKIEKFSVGFGRELFGATDRHGTRWSFSAIPLGGYVRFGGDENAASVPTEKQINLPNDPTLLQCRPTWQRAAVIAAGPLASLLLAVVIFAGIALSLGIVTTSPLIGSVVDGSPAKAAGFQPGDVVRSINGRKIASFGDIPKEVSTSGGAELTFVVARAGQEVALKVKPRLDRVEDKEFQQTHEVWRVGLGPASRDTIVIKTERVGVFGALQHGLDQTAYIATATGTYFRDVIRGKQRADQIGGIGRMVDVAGKVAKRNVLDLIPLAALISASVGLMNLLPFLPLDGGHLLNHAIEAVRGRPLSVRSQEVQAMFGLSFVFGLMMLAFYNDIPIFQRWFS
jgi:regulator of sigma E protease